MKTTDSWAESAPVGADQRKKIVVTGAGVVGLSCALWLQKSGHEVVLLDRNNPDDASAYRGAASYGNACTMAFGACLPVAMPGIFGQVPGMLLDRSGPLSIFWRDLPQLTPWLLSFLRASSPAEVDRIVAVLGQMLRLAEQAISPLIEAAGATELLRRTGCLYLFRSEREFAAARPGIAWREREGVRMAILDAAQIRAREPNLAPLYHKGVEFLDAYSFDTPYAYVRRLFDLFRQRGGRFVNAAVSGVDRSQSRLQVHCAAQSESCDYLVLAAGAWSGELAQMIGQKVRLNTERGYHVFFPGAQELLGAPTCYPAHGFYMTPLAAGLRCAGTVELGGLDQPARRVRTDIIAAKTRQLLPAVGEAADTWLGFRPSMPDSLPAIGAAAHDARVIHAYGHGHIGLTLSGFTGKIVSQIVDRVALPMDIGALRPERF